jgi:ABC-type transport system involved in multi-copper enzyme maturation permease subunit
MNTYRESVRERVLYNLLFFALLMTLSGLLLRDLSIRQDDRILKDLGLAAIDLFGTVIAIFIGVGLVNKEIDRRSLYPLLAKPLRRSEFVVGKFAGLSLTLLVNVAAMTAGLYFTLAVTRHPLDLHIAKAVACLYLGLLLTVALALFFSAVTSAGLAVVCTISLVLAGRFADVVRNMPEVAPSVPRALARAVYFALPNFANFDLKDRVVHADPISPAYLAWMAVYAVAYGGLLLTGAAAVFARRDLK